MNEIRISASDLVSVRTNLLGHTVERCAILLASTTASESASSDTALIVREVHLPGADDYLEQTPIYAQLTPAFVAQITKRARIEKFQLIFVHSHLDSHPPKFSSVDDKGEVELAAFMQRRELLGLHAALVISTGGVCARVLGTNVAIKVVSVGERRVVEFDPSQSDIQDDATFDRQIRAFGAAGQRSIQGLRVAIVGLGGTGSVLAQQLVHLGVRDFLLIDPDVLDQSNLNRVVSARRSDVGTPKVDIARRYIESFSDEVKVQTSVDDVCRASIAMLLTNCDFIFGCTDSHGSRSVIQQITYQYFVLAIDMGSTIATSGGRVTGIFGRVQLLSPGQGCLWCSQLLNSEEIRRDMMSDQERKLDLYIPGSREPAPSVISLNSTVVSIAVSMFLNVVTDVPGEARYVIYDARTSKLRSVMAKSEPDCFICSTKGVLGHGSGKGLFARQG
jgi:molybdopterin/thiamine biosynthesis adenylyltransferase